MARHLPPHDQGIILPGPISSMVGYTFRIFAVIAVLVRHKTMQIKGRWVGLLAHVYRVGAGQ